MPKIDDKMMAILAAREGEYRRSKPATADSDLKMFRAYWAGKSAVQIAMETPCAESTVYRAISRVSEFLENQESFPFMASLRRYVEEHPPNFGDWDAQSVLEMLYIAYSECNHVESKDTKDYFRGLCQQLRDLPLQSLDAVIDTVCDVCHCHERDGFIEGIKVGVRLGGELQEVKL